MTTDHAICVWLLTEIQWCLLEEIKRCARWRARYIATDEEREEARGLAEEWRDTACDHGTSYVAAADQNLLPWEAD